MAWTLAWLASVYPFRCGRSVDENSTRSTELEISGSCQNLQVIGWSASAAIGEASTASGSTSSFEYVSDGRIIMPTKSKSRITTSPGVTRRLPRNRPPTHPGEMLLEEFVKPRGITQTELAARLGVSYPRLNEILNRRRSVTPDSALRLARVVGMSANFWLGLQQDWDLWHAMNGPGADEISRLKPLPTDRS